MRLALDLLNVAYQRATATIRLKNVCHVFLHGSAMHLRREYNAVKDVKVE